MSSLFLLDKTIRGEGEAVLLCDMYFHLEGSSISLANNGNRSGTSGVWCDNAWPSLPGDSFNACGVGVTVWTIKPEQSIELYLKWGKPEMMTACRPPDEA